MTNLVPKLQAALADRYTIERELGQGGMAIVFLAQDIKHHRRVALKVLRPELAVMLGGERFLREIEIAAGLSHPHILPLFDSGETQEGLYYVMPYVDGESLRGRLGREGRLSIAEAVQITNELADALAYAHSLGIVHRDIKPENILFSAGHAVVTDFGIAKALTAAAKSDTLTQSGVAVGTPAYMSPEQASGNGPIDGRSDLYSLGCVLFEMLAGEPPFTGPTAQAVIAKRFTLLPPEIHKIRTGVSAGLSWAVAKLLAQDPADRYATATELLEALKAGLPAPGGLTSVDEQSIAVLPFVNMSTDSENEYFSDGITEEIINALSRLDALHVASRTSSFSFKGQSKDLHAVSAKLNVKYILEGSVRRAGSSVRIAVQFVDVARDVTLWSERYDRQINDIFAVQDDIATTVAGRLLATLGGAQPSSLLNAGTTNVEAYEECLKGRHFWNQRGRGLMNAVTHFQRATELDSGFVAPYAGLADSYCLYGLYGLIPQAEAHQKATQAVERALSLAPRDGDVQHAAGMVAFFFEWDLHRAEECFRSATRISPHMGRSWGWLAQMNGHLGRTDTVRDAARRAHEAEPISPLIAIAASGLLYCGCVDEAIGYVEAALDLDPHYAVANYFRGYCYAVQGRTEKALAAWELAHASVPNVWTCSALAVGYALAGNTERAHEAFARITELSGGNHPRWCECMPLIALGRVEEAVNAACVSLSGRHWNAWASGCQPLLEPITEHPRWQAAMREVGLEWVVEARLRHNAATASRSSASTHS